MGQVGMIFTLKASEGCSEECPPQMTQVKLASYRALCSPSTQRASFLKKPKFPRKNIRIKAVSDNMAHVFWGLSPCRTLC